MSVSGLARRWRLALLTGLAVLLVGGLATPAPAGASVCFMAYYNGFGSPDKDCPLGGNPKETFRWESHLLGTPYGVGVWGP